MTDSLHVDDICTMSPQEALAAMKITHEDEPKVTVEEFAEVLETLPAQIAGQPTEQKERFEVPVIQFLMPNGSQRDTSTLLPSSCKDAVYSMHDAGCRFEAEMLQTGEISVTISDPKHETDLDISVTKNGPEVQAGMVAMLNRGLWKKK